MAIKETSIEIYKKINNEGLLSRKRLQIYNIIYKHGAMTGSQVAQEYKLIYPSAEHSESIRNRITELVQQGAVNEIGTIKCPVTGNNVILFQTSDFLPIKVPKKLSLKQKKAEILKELIQLGDKVKRFNISNEKELQVLRSIYSKVQKL